MAILSTTPSYDGAPPAAGGASCGDLFGWLFGIFTVPTPGYEIAEVPATGCGGVPLGATGHDPAHTIVAPTGPVTIVIGTDVAFTQP